MSEQPWIQIWTDDLWASDNFLDLSVMDKGIYTLLMTRCRKQHFSGKFVTPSGKPKTIDEVIDSLRLTQGDRRDRVKTTIQTLIDKELLYWEDTVQGKVLAIRKFAKKAGKLKATIILDEPPEKPSSQEVGRKLAGSCTGSSQEVVRKLAGSSNNINELEQDFIPKPATYKDRDRYSDEYRDSEFVSIGNFQEQTALDLAKQHVEFCPADTIARAKSEFLSALISGIKGIVIEQAIKKHKGKHCWTIIDTLRKDGKSGTETDKAGNKKLGHYAGENGRFGKVRTARLEDEHNTNTTDANINPGKI